MKSQSVNIKGDIAPFSPSDEYFSSDKKNVIPSKYEEGQTPMVQVPTTTPAQNDEQNVFKNYLQDSGHSGPKVEFINIENVQQNQADQQFAKSARTTKEGLVNLADNEEETASSRKYADEDDTPSAIDFGIDRNNRIQRLLDKGLIEEDQYLALKLLERGYVPTDPSTRLKSAKASFREFVPPERLLLPVKKPHERIKRRGSPK